jgi:hypothetical protein
MLMNDSWIIDKCNQNKKSKFSSQIKNSQDLDWHGWKLKGSITATLG